MSTDDEGTLATYADHEAVDDHHVPVGRITDVIYDDAVEKPRWAIVRTGLLGGEHLAPLQGSYLADSGVVVLAYDKSAIKSGPKAPRDHVLHPSLEAEAARYFEMA